MYIYIYTCRLKLKVSILKVPRLGSFGFKTLNLNILRGPKSFSAGWRSSQALGTGHGPCPPKWRFWWVNNTTLGSLSLKKDGVHHTSYFTRFKSSSDDISSYYILSTPPQAYLDAKTRGILAFDPWQTNCPDGFCRTGALLDWETTKKTGLFGGFWFLTLQLVYSQPVDKLVAKDAMGFSLSISRFWSLAVSSNWGPA